MKIAVDAMGGDFGPQVNVEGAYLAAKNHEVKVVLVGDEDQVSKELSRYPTSKLPIYIHNAPHVVAMHDSPSAVLRKMKDTSIKVAIDLARDDQAFAWLDKAADDRSRGFEWLPTIVDDPRPAPGFDCLRRASELKKR